MVTSAAMFLLRQRSSNPYYKIRHCFSYNFSTLPNPSSVTTPYPIPRDPSSSPLPPHKEHSGWCATHLHAGVMMMIKLSNLDAAAHHARFTVSARPSLSSVRTCDALIGAMCRSGRYKDALNYFHYFFNESKLKPNMSCCNHVIRALCHQGQVDEAICFYKHLLVVKVNTPNEETYSLLVKGLVDTGKIKEAEDFVIEVMSNDQVSSSVFNHLIRGFLARGKFETAMEVFKDAQQRLGASPIDDQVSDLIHLLIDEDYNGIAMMTATFIEYWFRQGNDKEAMKCYASLLDKNFVMNAVTGNTLLRILLDYGKELEAKELFDQMVEKNAETCNILVNDCFKNSRIDEAVDYFRGFGTTVNCPKLCYRNIISRFCEQGMMSEAESFFEEMRSRQFIVPDIPTYRLLLDAFANAGRFDDAEQMVNLIVDANVKCMAKFRLL